MANKMKPEKVAEREKLFREGLKAGLTTTSKLADFVQVFPSFRGLKRNSVLAFTHLFLKKEGFYFGRKVEAEDKEKMSVKFSDEWLQKAIFSPEVRTLMKDWKMEQAEKLLQLLQAAWREGCEKTKATIDDSVKETQQQTKSDAPARVSEKIEKGFLDQLAEKESKIKEISAENIEMNNKLDELTQQVVTLRRRVEFYSNQSRHRPITAEHLAVSSSTTK